jgi:hypothetical protein
LCIVLYYKNIFKSKQQNQRATPIFKVRYTPSVIRNIIFSWSGVLSVGFVCCWLSVTPIPKCLKLIITSVGLATSLWKVCRVWWWPEQQILELRNGTSYWSRFSSKYFQRCSNFSVKSFQGLMMTRTTDTGTYIFWYFMYFEFRHFDFIYFDLMYIDFIYCDTYSDVD